jgi:hypothetical protein
MYQPYNPLLRRLLVADDSPSKSKLAPYFFDLLALAFILGTEETFRAGASWHLWGGELAAGIMCGVIGLRWNKAVALIAKHNPWERLRQAESRIDQLVEQLAEAGNNNTATAAGPKIRHVETVRFEYLPESPLKHGWKQVYNDDGIAEFGSDPDVIGSLRMKILQSQVAIHYDLPPHATRANRIEFRASVAPREGSVD